jgi:hypothetical protein
VPIAWAAAAAMLFVGVRLLLRARSNRGVPELLLGAFFTPLAIAIPFLNATSTVAGMQAQHATSYLAVGHCLGNFGFACLYVFTWRSFGTDSRWRGIFAALGIAGLVGSWIAQVAIDGFNVANGPAVLTSAFIRMVAVYWAFGEALHFYGRMRRRLKLGLADPITTNRFLLWSIWTGLFATIMLGAVGMRTLLLVAPTASVTPETVVQTFRIFGAIAAIVASGALWLNFFPPASYERRLRGAAA